MESGPWSTRRQPASGLLQVKEDLEFHYGAIEKGCDTMTTCELELECPHCNQVLTKWEPCPESGWGDDLYYCDNDVCAYFLEGRKRICREYHKNFSYRYCVNPKTGHSAALAAWCAGDPSLLKGRCKEELEDCKGVDQHNART
jgi:hypothetical protein